MEKFRVISDLHVDVNEKFPIELPKDNVFTVICGDTSGNPKTTIEWVKANVKSGILISGNHLPYCNGYHHFNEYDTDDLPEIRLMSELRSELAEAFPASSDITYLDVETGVFKKEVDGIMFIGTTMYTDMMIRHDMWNKTGDASINMACSEFNMNDYRLGYTSRSYPFGADNDPSYVRMRASDYQKWFMNAFKAIDEVLRQNEMKENPVPVVLVTHHPLIKDFCMHSYYVDNAQNIWRQREFNWASYASNREYWLKRHTSIKCYCCGHIHSPEQNYRSFKIKRDDGSEILVVNNARGYIRDCGDFSFNKNRFVNTKTWEIEEIPETEEEKKAKKDRDEKLFKALLAFM